MLIQDQIDQARKNAVYLKGAKYKTMEGAQKRARFETALQPGEVSRGDRAKAYRWYALHDGECWRVARDK